MSRAVNIPLMQWNPTVELLWLRAGFGIRIIICSFSPRWGSVARYDMPLQSLHLSAVYSDDYLKVTEEPNSGLQTWNVFAGLSKGRPNIVRLAKHNVLDGMHRNGKCAHFIHDITWHWFILAVKTALFLCAVNCSIIVLVKAPGTMVG